MKRIRHYLKKRHMESFDNKALTKPKILIIIGVILAVTALIVILKIANKQSSTVDIQATDGVFTSFSATATGKVTQINSSQIEIENNEKKQSFGLSKDVLIVQNNFLNTLTNLLITPVQAQEIPLRPSLPAGTEDTTSSGSSIPNIPAVPRKNIRAIKVGDVVSLNLTKEKESSSWIVTNITLLSQ